MCVNKDQIEAEKTGSIYFTCFIKPKHTEHPKMAIFAKVHILLGCQSKGYLCIRESLMTPFVTKD